MSAGKLSEQALTEKARGVYIIAATPFTEEGALDLQSIDTLTDFIWAAAYMASPCSA